MAFGIFKKEKHGGYHIYERTHLHAGPSLSMGCRSSLQRGQGFSGRRLRSDGGNRSLTRLSFTT